MAAARTPFVCQSQSVNVFLAADVHKRDLHQIHFLAWKQGLKSLYYCRSKSIQRAETATGDAAGRIEAIPHLGKVNGAARSNGESNDESNGGANGGANGAGPTDYDECLACQ